MFITKFILTISFLLKLQGESTAKSTAVYHISLKN